MNSSMKAESHKCTSECKITSDFEVLRKSPIFAGADSEVIRLFAYLAKRKAYCPNQQIITLGREADAAFYLISGIAKVTAIHNDKEVILQQLGPQTFFGELALLARFKWFFNVYAIDKCEAITISRESFKKVLDNFPERRERLIEKIVQLRVERLIDQTTFLMDRLPESLVTGGPSI